MINCGEYYKNKSGENFKVAGIANDMLNATPYVVFANITNGETYVLPQTSFENLFTAVNRFI